MTATYAVGAAQPTHRALMRADALSRASVLVWGPMVDVPTLSWFDGGREPVTALLDRVDTVGAYRLVPGETGTYAFVERTAREFDPEVLDRIADSGVVFVPPLSFRGTGELRFEAVGRQRDLSAFYDAVGEVVDLRLDRVRPFRRSGWEAPLTDRQHAAVVAAEDAGYYDIPRQGDVADVAAALDCAHSTAGELLRRAETALVGEHLDSGPRRR